MIVKMKFINISGPRDDIDRVTDLYLSRYEIQLESALSELKTVDNLRPFVEINPYRDALLKAQQYVGLLHEPEAVRPDPSMGLDEVAAVSRKSIPSLDLRQSIRNFAGVRAITTEEDFIIRPARLTLSADLECCGPCAKILMML